MATVSAIFRTNAVLPMEGRAAIRIKSDFCSPLVPGIQIIKPVDNAGYSPHRFWRHSGCFQESPTPPVEWGQNHW